MKSCREKHGPELGMHKPQCWAGTGSREKERAGDTKASAPSSTSLWSMWRHTPGGESDLRIRGITLCGGAGSSVMTAEGAWFKEVSDLGISIKRLPLIRKPRGEHPAAAGGTDSATVSAGPFPCASSPLPEMRTGKQSVEVN